MNSKVLTVWGKTGLVSLAVATLLAYWTRWQAAIVGSLIMLSCLVSLALIAIRLLALGLAKIKRSTTPRPVNQSILLVGFFILLQLAYIPISQVLRQGEIARAQAFAEALVPRIEAYQKQQGTYPATLEVVLSDEEKLPALLELHGDLPFPYDNQDFYFRRGATYGFRFYLPDGFIGYTHEYCCGQQGRWTVTD